MTGARPVFNDRALESPRTGYILMGAGATDIVFAVLFLILAAVAGLPAWWLLAGFGALVFGALVLAAGSHEAHRATEHRASMDSVTAQFARITGPGNRP